MLRRTEEVRNWVLEAQDGEIGSCKDFLFSDTDWVIRYMVADTGNWLPGRRVLISPASLGKPRVSDWRLPVQATKRQIENSPLLNVTEPVDQNYETRWHNYYGYPYYWSGPALWGGYPTPGSMIADPNRVRGYYEQSVTNPKVTHLKSTGDVTGYYVQASDGDIGHVEDFVFDDEDWSIRYLVVDTRNWLPGKKVLVAAYWFTDVQWEGKRIGVELPRERVKDSPEYIPEALNPDYEARLRQHYGMPP
jgi:hypothetical protein